MLRFVLLIEDEDAHAELISRQLIRLGAPYLRVERARNLIEGLEAIETRPPDAVLLDLGLPDTDRRKTVARFVAAAPRMPVVVLTSENNDNVGAEAVGEGADDFIVKGDADGRTTLRALRYAVERKRHSRQLLLYAKELQQANESLRHFSQLVAHELKQPLNPMLLNCAVLRRELTDPSQTALDSIGDIESAVRDMSRLVNDMLSFARFSAVRTPQEESSVGEVLVDVLSRLNAEIRERGASIAAEKMPAIRAHESLLRQLFLNLIGNALKHGKAEEPAIEIRCRELQEHFEFEVEDDGEGIASEYRSSAFDMFCRAGRTTDARGEPIDGSGIGLALCRMIVEHHGGTIGIRSGAQGGCVVWFRLPKAGLPET
ncbi:sensor histidine kinase [Engelhardtia mirabilis]|uniref:histidine kinase n=1 Tax=Engelhardtia mirabilis TaxID=2528011 RepID=A0A518BR02_9BACT|nr:Phytochrome-like protein cph1 [Planctomycetes bacterium Pla133]QDV03702.1 Phytochrome-like protein cph1 [Planctomycetes bacterium Pla86]